MDAHDKPRPPPLLDEGKACLRAGHALPTNRDHCSRERRGRLRVLAHHGLQDGQPGQAIWKSLQVCIARLRIDGQWGEVVRQEAIPKYFREKYGISNLYCIDLAAFHRGSYTIANRAIILLDIVDHPRTTAGFPVAAGDRDGGPRLWQIDRTFIERATRSLAHRRNSHWAQARLSAMKVGRSTTSPSSRPCFHRAGPDVFVPRSFVGVASDGASCSRASVAFLGLAS